LTQEGGGGRETRPPVTHELMLPFTRHLVGSHDHTPTLYSGQDGRTKLFEMAQLVVFHGARQSVRNVYASRDQFGPEMEFLEKVPTIWDEVRVLKAEPGDCVVIARRRGHQWFIGGMNDEDARRVALPLNFLAGQRRYQVTIFSDVPGSRDARRDVIQATSVDTLHVAMEPRGGLAAILEPLATP
jgi:alpha-glucosidase